MSSRKNAVCEKCGRLSEHVAKGFCRNCYTYHGTPLVSCKGCNQLKHHHAKGYCPYCYNKTFHKESFRLASRKRYSGITKEVFSQLDKKCLICGFDKIFDVHHLVAKSKGGSHEPSNLIVLCPNHHKMTHHADYRQEMLATISGRMAKALRTNGNCTPVFAY